MGDVLAFGWSPADPVACMQAQALELYALAHGWRCAWRDAGRTVFGRGVVPPHVKAWGDHLLVGLCLDRGGTTAFRGDEARSDPVPAARRLAAEAWGSFIGLMGPSIQAVYRDPSGGLEAFAWMRGPVRVVTSDPGPVAPELLPDRAALDWEAIAEWALDPGSAATRSGLEGVAIAAPGCVLELASGGAPTSTAVWRPQDFVRRELRAADPAPGLAAVVDQAVAGLVGPHAVILGELSGGLDSAIVASALRETGLAGRCAGWLNYYGDRPEGDERAYATAVAVRLGLELEPVAKPLTGLVEADFTETARGLRPAFPAVDPPRDRDTAQRLQAARASALVTGQGGDVVFFQMPTPKIAADLLWHGGIRALSGERLAHVARFSRTSAWSVVSGLRRRPAAPFRRPGLAADWVMAAAPLPDPWGAAEAGLPPAKAYQIAALYQSYLSLGGSRRQAAADILNPLLSQPVVEYCLSLSIPELTECRRDRALARRAFAGRLPATILERRSKGDLTAHYGRVIAASLAFLRPWLLDGVLCEARVLDRARVEAALQPEAMILHPLNSEVLIAVLIEAWVRWWQTRVADSPTAARPR